MRRNGSIASRRSFADAQDDGKGGPFFVILNEGCRSEGSTRSDFCVFQHPAREVLTGISVLTLRFQLPHTRDILSLHGFSRFWSTVFPAAPGGPVSHLVGTIFSAPRSPYPAATAASRSSPGCYRKSAVSNDSLPAATHSTEHALSNARRFSLAVAARGRENGTGIDTAD